MRSSVAPSTNRERVVDRADGRSYLGAKAHICALAERRGVRRHVAELTSLHDAIAEAVHDGDIVAMEGFTHLIPHAAGHEIIRQGRRDLTLVRLTPDLVFDQLIGAGCARKLIFSWGGNPGVGSLHRLRDGIERDWPTRLEIEEHSHAGLTARYVAGASGLPFGVLRGYAGTDLVGRTPVGRVTCPFTGEELAAVPALRPDVTIIHAQQADRAGNVALWGILGVQKEAVLAATRVVVTVEEIVDELKPRPGAIVLPSWTVGAVAHVPDGAHPSYTAGFSERDNAYYQAWDAISRDRAAFAAWLQDSVMSATASVPKAAAAPKPPPVAKAAPRTAPAGDPHYTPAEMMAVAASRVLADGEVCFVGIGAPSTAANLARATHAPALVLVYESGCIGAKPTRLPLSIGDGELADTADAVVSVPEIFSYWLQAGRIDVGFLGAAQIDRFANLNSTVVGDYDHPTVRLPGAGGAPEIASACRRVLIMIKQSPRSFVERLDFRTSVGFGAGPGDRERLGLTGAGPVMVITDLGVLEPDPETCELVLTRLHPGVTAAAVRRATGWHLRVADKVAVTGPPTPDELEALRRLEATQRTETVAGLPSGVEGERTS